MPEKTITKKTFTSKDSKMYTGYGKGVGGSSLGSNVPLSKKTDSRHAPGSYGYSSGTSSIKPGPSKKESKVINDKYRSKTPSTEERMKNFKNDPNAKNAVDYMTTSKGYQPDPLKARGGSEPKKKFKVRPKF